MGAMPWQELAPWNDDPNNALLALQSQYVAKNYDLPKILREWLDSSRQEINSWEADGDPFQLLGGLREKQAWLESILNSPLPTDPGQQVLIIRRLYSDSGQGIGNVLDVEAVSQDQGLFRARRLSEHELFTIFGTPHPLVDFAPQAFHSLANDLDRGESICFPVYDSNRGPVGWWFAGYTID